LETLLLRGFDTLSMLLEELQSPKGLTEEVGHAALAEMEPIFAETEAHIHQLLGEGPPTPAPVAAPAPAPAPTVSPLQTVMSQTVGQLMRDMLDLFKQRERSDVRARLTEIGESLYAIGTTHHLEGWQQLSRAICDAIAQPGNDLRNLALIALRDLKQGQQAALEGRSAQIKPSAELLAMAQAQPAPATEDPWQVALNQTIPRILKDILEHFKQSDATLALPRLVQLTQSLQAIGIEHQLPQWTNLIQVVADVLAVPDLDLKAAALPVLRDLKQAHQLLQASAAQRIEPSAELLALIPLPVEEPAIVDELESLFASDSDYGSPNLVDEEEGVLDSAPLEEVAASFDESPADIADLFAAVSAPVSDDVSNFFGAVSEVEAAEFEAEDLGNAEAFDAFDFGAIDRESDFAAEAESWLGDNQDLLAEAALTDLGGQELLAEGALGDLDSQDLLQEEEFAQVGQFAEALGSDVMAESDLAHLFTAVEDSESDIFGLAETADLASAETILTESGNGDFGDRETLSFEGDLADIFDSATAETQGEAAIWPDAGEWSGETLAGAPGEDISLEDSAVNDFTLTPLELEEDAKNWLQLRNPLPGSRRCNPSLLIRR
jgi:chemosensory pili system protein ChpA (sensor histidine kinase/response regulator)